MSALLLWIGAAIAAIGCISHIRVGGKALIRPLMSAHPMPLSAFWLGYCSWHAISALLAVSAGAYIWAALSPAALPAATLAAVQCGIMALVCIGAGLRENGVMLRLASPYVLGAIALIGAAGIASAP